MHFQQQSRGAAGSILHCIELNQKPSMGCSVGVVLFRAADANKTLHNPHQHHCNAGQQKRHLLRRRPRRQIICNLIKDQGQRDTACEKNSCSFHRNVPHHRNYSGRRKNTLMRRGLRRLGVHPDKKIHTLIWFPQNGKAPRNLISVHGAPLFRSAKPLSSRRCHRSETNTDLLLRNTVI